MVECVAIFMRLQYSLLSKIVKLGSNLLLWWLLWWLFNSHRFPIVGDNSMKAKLQLTQLRPQSTTQSQMGAKLLIGQHQIDQKLLDKHEILLKLVNQTLQFSHGWLDVFWFDWDLIGVCFVCMTNLTSKGSFDRWKTTTNAECCTSADICFIISSFETKYGIEDNNCDELIVFHAFIHSQPYQMMCSLPLQ